MRVFDIAGRCRPERGFLVPPERRLLDAVTRIDERAHFDREVGVRDKRVDRVQRVAMARRLGRDDGVWVIVDCRSVASQIEGRTRLEAAGIPDGRNVTLLRA